ncbi:MAG: hypothetical protein K8R53_05250 [Bacteroidales bacterium]|nr:hypothetical protein [Bacteroidales bacterium]
MADDNLLALVNFIETNNCFDYAGQHAVWCLTDNYSINSISGFDTTNVLELQSLVSELTGQKLSGTTLDDDYENNFYAPPQGIVIYGDVEFSVPYTSDVTLALFNRDQVIVRELFNRRLVRGRYGYNFSFDASVYTDPYYQIKLIINDDVALERRIDIND